MILIKNQDDVRSMEEKQLIRVGMAKHLMKFSMTYKKNLISFRQTLIKWRTMVMRNLRQRR